MRTRTITSAFLALVLASMNPAKAWEFTPGIPCVLTHETADAAVKLTYDPAIPVYTIAITQTAPFIAAPVFAIQFNGPLSLAITTDRHRLSDDDRTFSVTDSGFGNVLNGMQFNQSFTATLGDQTVTIPLTYAAPAVAAFRACDVLPAV